MSEEAVSKPSGISEITRRVCDARKEVQKVVKDLTRKDKGYDYVSANNIYNATREILSEHYLDLVANQISVEREIVEVHNAKYKSTRKSMLIKSWWLIGFAGEEPQRRYQEGYFYEAPSHGALQTLVIKYYIAGRMLIVVIDEKDFHDTQPYIKEDGDKARGKVRVLGKGPKNDEPLENHIEVIPSKNHSDKNILDYDYVRPEYKEMNKERNTKDES